MERDDLTAFEESWASAIRVATIMTTDRGDIPTRAYQALASHWSPAQIVEIIAVIGLFNYFNRFAIALDIPPTK